MYTVGGVRCSALKLCNFDNYGMENYCEQTQAGHCKLTMVRLENIFLRLKMLVEISREYYFPGFETRMSCFWCRVH
jgi:hypothetical protein